MFIMLYLHPLSLWVTKCDHVPQHVIHPAMRVSWDAMKDLTQIAVSSTMLAHVWPLVPVLASLMMNITVSVHLASLALTALSVSDYTECSITQWLAALHNTVISWLLTLQCWLSRTWILMCIRPCYHSYSYSYRVWDAYLGTSLLSTQQYSSWIRHTLSKHLLACTIFAMYLLYYLLLPPLAQHAWDKQPDL